METLTLKNTTDTGEELVAIFMPHLGMNMISFKIGDVELIDQSTGPAFEARFAGLGALIGPHFHRRRAEILPHIKDEGLFPHIAYSQKMGIVDPFSHGISRYAPWKASSDGQRLQARLRGKDEWNGVPLSALEGQDFEISLDIDMTTHGLKIDLSVVSATDSVIGIHYYYHLPAGTNVIKAQVKNEWPVDALEGDSLNSSIELDPQMWMNLALEDAIDKTFHSFPDPCQGVIHLDTDVYTLKTTYVSPSEECAWQLYHPKDATFVCIEPVSAKDPRRPNLTVSSLKITLDVELKKSL